MKTTPPKTKTGAIFKNSSTALASRFGTPHLPARARLSGPPAPSCGGGARVVRLIYDCLEKAVLAGVRRW